MRCHSKILLLSLLTLPLQSTTIFANPLFEQNCSLPNCQNHIYAQRSGEGPRRGRGKTEKLIEELNLNDNQVQQLNAIRQKYRPQMQQLREQMQATRQELSQMMQGNTSTTDLRKKHQQVIDLDQKLHNLRFENMLAIREILTPEQRRQFAQLMEQRRANRRNGARFGR